MTYNSRYFVDTYFPSYFQTVLKTQPEALEDPYPRQLSVFGSHRSHVIITVPMRAKSRGTSSAGTSLRATIQTAAHSHGTSQATAQLRADITLRTHHQNQAIAALHLSQ